MFCKSCGTQLHTAVKFCPSCGAPQQQTPPPAQDSGLYGRLQDQLGALPVVGTIQERLNGIQVPTIAVGAGGPAATRPDLLWSAVYLLATLMTIWATKWYVIPFVLAAGALTLIYAVRPGVSLVTRSILFIVASAIGIIGIYRADSIPDAAAFAGLIFMVVAGRGIWGLLKEARTVGDTVPIEGQRLKVLITGLAVCLVATMFQWQPVRSYSSVSWKRVGTVYTDSSGQTVQDSTWMSPDVNWSFFGGENGSNALPWLLAAGILLLVYRSKPWPRWLQPALTVCFALMLVYALEGLGQMISFGILLFFAGFGAIGWSLMTKRA